MSDENKGAVASFMGGGALSIGKAEMAAALNESAQAGGTGSGDVDYLSFSGQGANYKGWTIGRDKVAPEPDAIYILDPKSAIEGWITWKGGAPVEKHSWSVYERKTQAVPQSQLVDHGPYADGDGPQFSMGISMLDIDAPGNKIEFSSSSKSGRNVLADLNKEIAKRIMGDEPFVPIITLTSEKFVAHGKTNGKPKFGFEGWVTEEEVMAFLAAGDDGDLEDLLTGKYAAGEEVVEEPEEAAPAKRRARRSAA